MIYKIRAVTRKFWVVSGKDKIKLLGKMFLRLFGVRKHLFLGGYYQEQDDRQYEQDMQIYLKLKAEKIYITNRNSSYTKDISVNEKIQSGRAEEQIKELLKEQGSYLALAVQHLERGGLEEVVRLLVIGLHEKQIPVKIFCIQRGGEIAEELKAKDIEVLVFDGNKDALAAYCRENRPLVVNTHYVSEYLNVFNQFNIPVIEVIHNMYVFLNQTGIETELRKIPYIQHYIAVSKRAKEIFVHKFPSVPQQKVTVIGNALEGNKSVNRSKEEIRASLGISRDAFVYIAVGSIDARKNQIGMLRAWDIIKRITDALVVLVIVGGGTDCEYEYKVQKFIKERNLRDSVIFTGHSSEVYNLLNAADVFVLDSYYEGWSMAATEALLCGLPLIHSDCGSGRELTAEGKNGILIDNPLKDIETYDSMFLYDAMHAGINDNIEQLASAMLEMLNRRDDWQQKRGVIRQYAIDHFSSDAVIEKYLEVYLDVWGKEWSKDR